MNPGSRSFNSEPRDITLATRMVTFGRLAAFDEAKDNWWQYAERMQQFFVANEIEDDQHPDTTSSTNCDFTIACLVSQLLSFCVVGS